MTSAARILAALSLLLSTGCARPLLTPRSPIPDDARRVVDLLLARWNGFSGMRAVADLEVERPSYRQRFLGVLLVKRPDSVRLEALSPFGQPFLYLVVHGGTYLTYDVVQGEASTGPANEETTARLFGLAFDPTDLASVLSGHAVPPPDLRAAEVSPAAGASSRDTVQLDLWGPSHRKRVWLSRESGVVEAQEIEGGRYSARVSYARSDAGELRGLRIEASHARAGASVQYRTLALDEAIAPSRFVLDLPEGTRLYRIP